MIHYPGTMIVYPGQKKVYGSMMAVCTSLEETK